MYASSLTCMYVIGNCHLLRRILLKGFIAKMLIAKRIALVWSRCLKNSWKLSVVDD